MQPHTRDGNWRTAIEEHSLTVEMGAREYDLVHDFTSTITNGRSSMSCGQDEQDGQHVSAKASGTPTSRHAERERQHAFIL